MPSETSCKGELACLKFEQRAIEKGLVVCRPIVECSYDRLLEQDGKFLRIQVKYADRLAQHAIGAVVANISKSGKRGIQGDRCVPRVCYNDDEIDIMVVYIPKIDKICWFERQVWSGKMKLQLRYEPSKNNQTKGCRLASDYFW